MWCVLHVCSVYVHLCVCVCGDWRMMTLGSIFQNSVPFLWDRDSYWPEDNWLGWIQWPPSLRNPPGFAFEACTSMCSIFTRVQWISSDPRAWKANNLPRDPSQVMYEQEELKEEIINKLKNKEGYIKGRRKESGGTKVSSRKCGKNRTTPFHFLCFCEPHSSMFISYRTGSLGWGVQKWIKVAWWM